MRLVSRLLSAVLVALLLSPATAAFALVNRIESVSFSDESHGVIAGGFETQQGFISTTSDGGRTWKASRASMWMAAATADGAGGWGVQEYGDALWRSDAGEPWRIEGTVDGAGFKPSTVVMLGSDRIAAAGWETISGQTASILTSDDDGQTWQRRYNGPLYFSNDPEKDPPSTKAQMQSIGVAPGGSSGYALANEWTPSSGGDGSTTAYKQMLVFKTIDGGSTWTTATVQPTSGFPMYDIASASATSAFAVGEKRVMFKTTNGTTWVRSDLPRDTTSGSGQTNVNAYSVDALSSSLVLIGADGGRIGVSRDGSTWTYRILPGASIIRDVDMITASHWIAVGDNETIYHTYDAGQTWQGTAGVKAPTVKVTAPSGPQVIGGSSFSLAGTSTDASGTGVLDVDISIYRSDGTYFNGTTWQAAQAWLQTTTSDNWATWDYDWALPAGQAGQHAYTIVARATDGAGTIGTASVAGVTVNNSAPGAVAGTVTDLGTAAPIADAAVTIGSATPVTTGGTGTYLVSDLAPGTYSALYSATGYASRTQTVTVTAGATTTSNVALTALPPLSGSVRGRVMSGGQPVAGASVTLGNLAPVLTDAAGAYVVPAVTTGIYGLTVSKSGFVSASFTGVSVVSGQETVRDVVLVPNTGTLSGVVSTAGQLRAGVSVKVGTAPAVTTAANGAYTVPGLTPGTHTATFSYAGFLSEQHEVTIVAGEATALSVDLAAEPPTTGPVVPTRVSSSSRFSGSAAIARSAFDLDPVEPGTQWGARNIVIASGEDRAAADPLAAAGLCGVLDAPLLLVSSTSVDSSVKSVVREIATASEGAPVNVYLVGGLASVPDARYNDLVAAVGSSGTLVKKRLATGGTRYDMAATIARTMRQIDGNVPDTVLVANGADPAKFFDALALSPISAYQGYPILLVSANDVPSATQSVINEFDPGRVIVGGGPNTVSEGVRTSLGGVRWSGSTRYSTALTIADKAVAEAGMSRADVGVAAVLPDALTGGSAVGMRGGVLVLTDGAKLTAETGAWITAHRTEIERCEVFGGLNSLSDSVKSSIAARLTP